MKLYYAPHMASRAVLITAFELGIDVEMVKVDMATKRLECGKEFSSITPKALIPALEMENGSILTETSAILMYLAGKSPDKSLVPKYGSEDYYRLLEWMNYFSSEIHKFYTFLFWENADAFKETVKERILAKFALLDQMVDGEYLVGDSLTLADIYLFINAKALFLLGATIDQYPRLARIVNRVEALPSVARAMALHE